jgi:hypothetical protein
MQEKKFQNRHINYSIALNGNSEINYYSNIIKIYHPERLSNFWLTVAADNIHYPGPVEAKMMAFMYTVNNSSSNYFKITLPEITYDFISQRRMEGELMLIKDRNTIFWDGKYFKRVE